MTSARPRGRQRRIEPVERSAEQIADNLLRLSRQVGASSAGGPATKKKLPGAPSRRAAVPKMLPREQLTRKARAAIEVYASTRSYIDIITACLKAERMARYSLYAILKSEGYRWNPKRGRWIK